MVKTDTKNESLKDRLERSTVFSRVQKNWLLDHWTLLPEAKVAELTHLIKNDEDLLKRKNELVLAKYNSVIQKAKSDIKAVNRKCERTILNKREALSNDQTKADRFLDQALNSTSNGN